MKTLKEISPEWNEIFTRDWREILETHELEHELDIYSYSTCVVGEAYGFSDNYYGVGENSCQECTKDAIQFGHFSQEYQEAINQENNWQGTDDSGEHTVDEKFYLYKLHSIIKNFEKHWNEKHL